MFLTCFSFICIIVMNKFQRGWRKPSHQENVVESAIIIQFMWDVQILIRSNCTSLFLAAMGSWYKLLSWLVTQETGLLISSESI